MLFRPKVKFTDASLNVLGFFLDKYVSVMNGGKDGTDERMKVYLASVIEQLGVPRDVLPLPEPEAAPPVEVEESNPIIVRQRRYYGTGN